MRWIFRLIGLVLVLVLLAVGTLFLIPSEKIAALAAREIEARTGRTVSFDGAIRPAFWPVIGVRTGSIRIGNADWTDGTPMVTADALLVGVELVPLLSGEVRVKEFRLDKPSIRLETARDGRTNWSFSDTSAPATGTDTSASGALEGFTLDDGQISGGTLTYIDHAAGSRVDLGDIDLSLAMPTADGQATIRGSLAYGGQKVGFDAAVNGLAGFLDGRLSDASIALTGAFGKVGFTGAVDMAPSAEGQVSASMSDLPAAMALAGLSGAPGRKASFEGRVIYTAANTLHLRDAKAALDGNAMSLDADLTLSGRPKLTAKVDAGALDLKSFLGTGDDGTPSPSGDEGWSKDPIDASGLGALDAEIALSAASVDLGSLRFGTVRTRAKLDTGRLVLDLQQVTAYDGTLSGEFVVNARKGLSLGGDLTFADVDLQGLLIDMAEYDRLRASGDVRLKFLVVGNSMDALMKGMSGSGSVAIGQGEIIGFDLAGMIRNFDPSYRGSNDKTIFSSIKGSFTIDKGVLSNEDLAFRSPVLTATGQGTVDIGRQRLSYRVTPVAFGETVEGDTGRVLVPILIDGTWSDVNFHPDLSGVVGDEIDKQKKEAEEKLKGTVEDVRKDTEERLRNEAEKALREGVEKSLGDLLKKLP
jgi:AsmA protein